MTITLEMTGGIAYFPALSNPVMIDTAQVEMQIGNELEVLVRDARFFGQPASVGAPSLGAADYRSYTITIKDGARMHAIQRTDPITDVNLARLVSRIFCVARAANR